MRSGLPARQHPDQVLDLQGQVIAINFQMVAAANDYWRK